MTPSSTRPRSPSHLESRVSSAEPSPLPCPPSSPPRRVHRSAASHGGLRVLRGRSRVLRTSVVADGATPGHGLVLLPDPGAGAGAMPGADPSTDLAGGRSGGQTPRRPLAWAPCPRPAGPLPGCWARVPSAATSRQAFDTRPWPRAECRAHRGHHAALPGASCRPGPSASRHLPCSRGGASHRCLFSSAACVPGGVTALRVKPGVGGG